VANPIEVLVPDIGGFKDVSVIDVLVKDGQQIEKEAPLITIETEKAAMDVPAPMAGRITQVKLKQGDKVSEGSVILLIEPAAAEADPARAASAAAAPEETPPAAAAAAKAQTAATAAAPTPRRPPPRLRLPPRGPTPRSTKRHFHGPTPAPRCANSRASWAPTWAESRAPAPRAASRKTM
jgi:pyruvate/2-oxoglutarate dehydrogenase complex dihydrolipoamide acyltransferase (E2) component